MGRAVLVCLTCASSLSLISSCAVQGSDTTTGTGEREIGSVGMNLEVAEDIDLDEVSFYIDSQQGRPIAGTIPVTGGDMPVQKLISDVPAGTAQVTLRGIGHDGALCEGFGSTYVRGGKTSFLAILLNCLLKGHRGNVDVRGKFNICPETDLASCVLTQATVGVPFAMTATGHDPDGDRLAFHWTSTAGSFSDATAQSTRFTCEDAGTQTVEFSVDDGRGCTDTQEITVFCAKAGRAVCGNGKVEAGEACDDGNRRAGDGCAPDCTEEPVNESVLCGPDVTGALTRCTCDNCSEQIAAAENASGVAQTGPAAGTPRSELAIDLIQCQRTSGCHGLFCLCGAISNAECFGGDPAGPCIAEFLAAAETDIEALASTRLTNTMFALGLANAVDACAVAECAGCL